MADLKALYEKLGFEEVITYIQSGNVVFKSKSLQGKELVEKIESAISNQYGFHVPVIIRNREELEKVISGNPFLQEKNVNLDKLHVTFLSEPPVETNFQVLAKMNFAPDKFCVMGKEIFLYIPESYGNTKLSNNFFESKLKVKATTRNWKTVNKLLEIADSLI